MGQRCNICNFQTKRAILRVIWGGAGAGLDMKELINEIKENKKNLLHKAHTTCQVPVDKCKNIQHSGYIRMVMTAGLL